MTPPLIALFHQLVKLLMTVTPRRHRFRMATALACCIPRRFRHTRSSRMEPRPGISSVRELLLGSVLESMDQSGLAFDPAVRLEGGETIDAALDRGRGVLLLGTHANGSLGLLALRSLHDAGTPLTIVAVTDRFPICSTGKTMASILPVGNFMLTVRDRFRDGYVVCAMLDSYQPSDHRPFELRATAGSVWFTDSLIRLARSCDAPVVFVAARLESDRSVTITIRPASEQAAEDVRDQFVTFFEHHIAETASATRTLSS